MSTLLLVRHGKASPGAADYDNLSEIGAVQARMLGEHWATAAVRLDAVYVGPRRRHAQTLEQVRDAYVSRGLSWPSPTALDGLDEHAGVALVYKLLPAIAAEDAALKHITEAMARGETPPLDGMLSAFKHITRRWVRGEVGHEEIESWRAFRERVSAALESITRAGRGKNIAVFTSAGAVAAMVGLVLDLGDEKVLDLSWSLYNGSVTEVVFAEGRLGLRTFNATPHLADAKLVTSV